jgi:hypothetical protein
MSRSRILLVPALLLAAAIASGQGTTGPDPREHSFQLFIDGVQTAGMIGYRIEFNHNPVLRTDSRRLDTAYSPDQRKLILSVTQKGLNRLQDWLNSATSSANPAPPAKNVSVVARDNQENVLARWELTGVQPQTFSSAGAGTLTEVDATIEFTFDTLTLTLAKAD